MKKLFAALSLFVVQAAGAVEFKGFEIDGFLTVVGSWTDVDYLASGVEPTYITSLQKRPSFDNNNTVGLQFSKTLYDNVSFTAQLTGDGEQLWKVEAAWAFIKWQPSDKWQFRVGRIRTSPYMFSDYLKVGYAYPWVRPPMEVYSQVPEEFSNNTGVDVQFTTPLGKQDFLIRAFYGANTGNLEFPAGPNIGIMDIIKVRLRDIFCINAKIGDEVFNIRAGYERGTISLYPNAGSIAEGLNTFLNAVALPFPVQVNPAPPPEVFVTVPGIGLDYVNYFTVDNVTISFMEVGYEFHWNNIVSMGELVKRQAAAPTIGNAIGWYLMGGYQIKNFMPHITFSRERLTDNSTRRFNSYINSLAVGAFGIPLNDIAQQFVYASQYFPGAGSQTSVTLGLRWDVIVGVAIKFEYQRVHPDFYTPGLFNVDPGKSVNIFNIAVNAVM